MTWIWSFSCDVRMKDVYIFFFGVGLGWGCGVFLVSYALHSNVDLATLPRHTRWSVLPRVRTPG
jgi:hypothetical protein